MYGLWTLYAKHAQLALDTFRVPPDKTFEHDLVILSTFHKALSPKSHLRNVDGFRSGVT